MPEPNTTGRATRNAYADVRTERRKDWPTLEQMQALRITEVRLHEQAMECHLSDGHWLGVPLTVSRAVAEAPPVARFQWRISGDGKAVFWYTEELKAHLSLREMLDCPESELREAAAD